MGIKREFDIKPLIIKVLGILLLVNISSSVMFGFEIDHFQRINSQNGLSHNSVLCMLKDSKGFMWFGTWNGLNRYDGYHFKVYRSLPKQKQLLSHNRITNLYEDPHGFIWVKSYDGYYHIFNPLDETFTSISNNPDPLSEQGNIISTFFQYNNDEIWLGSEKNGIFRMIYDKTTNSYSITNYTTAKNLLSSNNVTIIKKDAHYLWVGTTRGINRIALDSINSKEITFSTSFPRSNVTCFAYDSTNTWIGTTDGLLKFNYATNKTTTTVIKKRPINAITKLPNGNLLVGSTDLFLYNTKKDVTSKIPVQGSIIEKIYADKKGSYWITTDDYGVSLLNKSLTNTTHYDLTPSEITNQVEKERQVYFEDSKCNLWIGVHGGGLSLFNDSTKQFDHFRNHPNDPKSISSNFVHCITEDEFGTIWVGTGQPFGSINKIIQLNQYAKNILPAKNNEHSSENVVRAMLEDSNGNIWVSTKNGMVYIYNSKMEVIHSFPFAPLERNGSGYNVYTMFQDSKGYIWLGAKSKGVGVTQKPLGKDNSAYNEIAFNYLSQQENTNSLSYNDIYSISEDINGRIWIGTFGGGLDILERRGAENYRFRHVNMENSNLGSNNIRYILKDYKNEMWLATSYGLYHLSVEKIQKNLFTFDAYFRDRSQYSISYNDIVHICEDSQHRLWFSTLGGGVNQLISFNHGKAKFINFSQQDGLSNDEVYSITEDEYGILWMATGNGISPFNPETQTFKQNNALNRLTNTSFSESTALRKQNGDMLFATSKGFEVIRPSELNKEESNTQIRFTSLQIFNRTVDVGMAGSPLKKAIPFCEKLSLKYNQSSFSLEFSALNFQDKELNKYSYILKGFDNEWKSVGFNNVATYTNVPPGKYMLQVKTASDFSSAANMEITILPPWWKTTKAYLLYAILTLLVLYIVIRYARRINLYKNDLLVEKRVNSEKLKFFTNISHEIRTPLTLILGPIEDLLAGENMPHEAKHTLASMSRNGKRMLHLINQLLDFRKVQNDKMILNIAETTIETIVRENFTSFEYLAKQKEIDFTLISTQTVTPIFLDHSKIDSVLFNLLSNAFKFTPSGKKITVKIEDEPAWPNIQISICDQGKGIPENQIQNLFQRFSILSNENNENGGTGIGLNLSYEFIKLHQGEIKVTSKVGTGSCFTILLKKGRDHFNKSPYVNFIDEGTIKNIYQATDTLQKVTNEENETALEFTTPDNAKKILLVEDNIEIITYINGLLNNQYKVFHAEDGEKGLEIALLENPDIIITDVMMPVMDGIAMTKAIKDNLSICHIPIVMLTAKTDIKDHIIGVKAGAEVYVTKPFNGTYLKTVISNLLKQREIVQMRFQDKKEINPKDLNISEKDETFMNSLVHFIEQNYETHKLSVDELAEELCVSRTVFYNKVKGLTGLSPVEFIRQIKLKISGQLLEKGYNVSEVANIVGYNDVKYFSRKFKELFGYSPSKHGKENNL